MFAVLTGDYPSTTLGQFWERQRYKATLIQRPYLLPTSCSRRGHRRSLPECGAALVTYSTWDMGSCPRQKPRKLRDLFSSCSNQPETRDEDPRIEPMDCLQSS